MHKMAGVDEVGRGCLAGPVFAAAVILNKKISKKYIKDSKKIPFKKRILISNYIKKNSVYAIGTASVVEINRINITDPARQINFKNSSFAPSQNKVGNSKKAFEPNCNSTFWRKLCAGRMPSLPIKPSI